MLRGRCHSHLESAQPSTGHLPQLQDDAPLGVPAKPPPDFFRFARKQSLRQGLAGRWLIGRVSRERVTREQRMRQGRRAARKGVDAGDHCVGTWGSILLGNHIKHASELSFPRMGGWDTYL